jgi:4-amino-4-deoxy-L-arabinose transferase-like glycosyltransferase
MPSRGRRGEAMALARSCRAARASASRVCYRYPPLDRSNGFLLKHEWLTVYSENKPDFKKPPLQYWVTAFSLKNFSDTTFATRLPSFLFGIGLLVATGFLACLIEPDNPYAAPAAMIILSSSTFYWQMAISAFLDTGMVFFSVVAVVATLLALRRPKFWYLAALAVGAGALQKAPVAALLVGGILLLVPLTKKYHEIKLAAVFANKHFRIALLLSVVLIAFWPALQVARFGYKAIEQQYVDEMLERFNPIKPVTQFHGWYDIFVSAEAVVWIPAIIATLILPFVFKKFEAFVPVFIFLGFCLVVGKASGFVHHRYALLTLPFLAASLAALLARVLPGRITVLACAVGLSFLVGGPFKRAEALGLMFNGQEQYKPLLERLRAALLPQETLITCRWKEVPDPTIWFLPGSLSYYGSNGHPIYLMRRPEDISRQEHIKNKIRPPYRGLCRSGEFEQLKEWLADYRVVEQSNGYVHWISNGSVQPPR